MEESAILLTLTQVNVAFVGFAGIIAAFQSRDGLRMKKVDAIGLEIIIHTGLVGIFLSLLPLVLLSFGLGESSVWGLCSAVVSINFLIVLIYRSRHIKKKYSNIGLLIQFSIFFLVILLNLSNTFDIIFHREFGPFFISLIVPLCLVGYMFARLLLVPIWRIVRDHDSENINNG